MKEEIIKILNKLRKMSQEEIQEYDIKNQMAGFPIKGGGLKSICLYKLAQDFDCDSMLYTIVCCWLAFGLSFDKKSKKYISNGYIPNKINNYYGLSYEFVGNDFNYRGDTMNSYGNTFHEFLRIYPHFNEKISNDTFIYRAKNGKYGTNSRYNYLKTKNHWEICILDNYNYFKYIIAKKVPSADNFFNLTHTIGNMILCPVTQELNFNTMRGLYKTFSKDYWDIALLCIYNDYHKIQSKTYTLSNLLKNNKATKLAEKWLTEKVGSWEKFIKINYLQSFVDENNDNKPRVLWDKHLEENSSILPTIENCDEYFKNASEMIKQRGEKIAKKIKDVLNNMTNDKIIETLDIK